MLTRKGVKRIAQDCASDFELSENESTKLVQQVVSYAVGSGLQTVDEQQVLCYIDGLFTDIGFGLDDKFIMRDKESQLSPLICVKARFALGLKN